MLKKLWVKVTLAVLVLVVVALVAAPFLVNAERFRPMLERTLTQTLDRKVTLGQLSFSLLAGSLEAGPIVIADDPAFSAQPFLKAQKLEIGVEVKPLLLERQLHITHLKLDEPEVQLIQNPAGEWNFSSMGSGATSSPSSDSAAMTGALTVASLKVANGQATVTRPGTGRPPFVYSGMQLAVDHFAFDKAFPVTLAAALPEKGTLNLKGTLGPLAAGKMQATPFEADLAIGHFDPVATGVVDRNAEISMLLDATAHIGSDGKSLSTQGQLKAQRLHLARTGAPARQTVAVDFATALELESRSGQLKNLAIRAGQAAARIQGAYRITDKGALLDLRLTAPGLPLDQLQDLLPAAGITLPQGSRLEGGTLNSNLTIKGPATALTIAGPVEIANTRLAGFDIGSRLEGVNPFGGKGGGTNIQTLRANLVSTPAVTEFQEIYASLPQVGTASGSGTINASEQLNFTLSATFDPAAGIGALAVKTAQSGLNSLMGRLGAFGQRLMQPKANGAIPLTVTGTAANPVIRVQLKKLF